MAVSFIGDLISEISDVDNVAQLHSALSNCVELMGFDHFALAYDQRMQGVFNDNILVHDYPESWAKVYVGFELAGTDPIRRASERSMTGFEWRHLEQYIPLTRSDRQMLFIGKENGIGDGYTVPRHLPGEASGSCTFAVHTGNPIPVSMLNTAEIVGAVALTVARRIAGERSPKAKPTLSERQRECVLWSARGKTAGEVASILGISEETVIQHLKLARDRYDVHCRQALILCALFDGLIGFGDIFRKWDG